MANMEDNEQRFEVYVELERGDLLELFHRLQPILVRAGVEEVEIEIEAERRGAGRHRRPTFLHHANGITGQMPDVA